jgi:glycosyltransferase involved in cell wall biosynthesis
MSSFVSIGIPCFNAEKWIAGAIESALSQTWTDKEVIVVDDGSNDASCDRIMAFGDRVRLFRCDHRGGNHARNEILKHARGDWIQFLDADDYLEPEKIARQFSEGNCGHDADVLYSPYWFERSGPSPGRWQSELHTGNDLFVQWLSWELPQTGAALWRKSALQQLGGWKADQPCCQEHELYLRALKADLRLLYTPTAHAVYRLWSDETVCRKDPGRTIQVKTGLIDDARTWLKERGRWTSQHQATAARACFEMARMLARDDLSRARIYYSERRKAGLMQPAGPAAPFAYRLAYHVLGFEKAERLAARRRN